MREIRGTRFRLYAPRLPRSTSPPRSRSRPRKQFLPSQSYASRTPLHDKGRHNKGQHDRCQATSSSPHTTPHSPELNDQRPPVSPPSGHHVLFSVSENLSSPRPPYSRRRKKHHDYRNPAKKIPSLLLQAPPFDISDISRTVYPSTTLEKKRERSSETNLTGRVKIQ